MERKRLLSVFGFTFLFFGLMLLLGSFKGITSNAIAPLLSGKIKAGTGIALILIAAALIIGTLKLETRVEPCTRHKREKERDKPIVLRTIRDYIRDYRGDATSLIDTVVDELAAINPNAGFKSTEAKRHEMRELENISSLISKKYHMDKDDIYEIISKELHSSKRHYGRRGR